MKNKVFLILITVFLSLVGFVIYVGYDVISGTNKPTIILGNEAKGYISSFLGTKISQSATSFFYSEDGFQDVFYNIGLTLPSQDAWKLINTYAKVTKKDFKKEKISSQYYNNKDHWDISKMENPLFFSKVKVEKNYKNYTLIIYDEVTKRLLIAFSSY